MTTNQLDYLYRQVVMAHAADPHHYGEIANPTNQKTGYNPSCGDVVRLTLTVNDDQITAIAFQGEGCTISKASASMMTDLIVNQPLSAVPSLINTFSELVRGDCEHPSELGEARLLAGVSRFPARIKCAQLPWQTLSGALAAATSE